MDPEDRKREWLPQTLVDPTGITQQRKLGFGSGRECLSASGFPAEAEPKSSVVSAVNGSFQEMDTDNKPNKSILNLWRKSSMKA